LDAEEILDEEEFSGIPEGFDQGVSNLVQYEDENESGSATSEEDSDETELLNALSKFMNKDKSKPKLKVKGPRKVAVARPTSLMPVLWDKEGRHPILLRALTSVSANGT
jgi:hypothetical protein